MVIVELRSKPFDTNHSFDFLRTNGHVQREVKKRVQNLRLSEGNEVYFDF